MYDDYDDYLDELDDELDSYEDEIDGYDDELSRLEDEESFLDAMYGIQTDKDDKTEYEIRKAYLRGEKDHIRFMRDMAKSDRDNVRYEREIARHERELQPERTNMAYEYHPAQEPSFIKRAITTAAIYHFFRKLFG